MKRTVSLLLSLALALAFLPACAQSGPEPDLPAPEPEVLLTARELAETVLPASGRKETPDVERLNAEEDADRLSAYIEAVCGLASEQWEDAAVIRGMGASAFEIVVLRLGDEDAAAGLETVLTDYLTVREGAFTGYAPAEAEMAANGRVRREGRTVGLFICPDPEGAAAVFSAACNGEELPPLPEPEPEPEPVALDPVSPEMQPLLDALAESCASEIGEITAAGGTVSAASPDETGSFAERVESAYGITPEQWVDGFTLRSLSPDTSLFELAVFRMTDQDTAIQCMESLWDYKERMRDQFCTIDSDGVWSVTEEQMDGYTYLTGAHAVQIGEYTGLFICRNAEEANNAFMRARNSISSGTPDHKNPEGPPFIEIAEDVFVTEAMWPELEGDFDPDYPERIRYVPTGNELMEVYDTSAIAAAWQAEDPGSLSDYDRAIYDNAKEVLDDILQDGMSDFEKEVEIYDWVLRNVNYDWSHEDVLEETGRDAYTPYGGLVNRAGVCLGFASTFQLLMELAGVECLTVVGVGLGTDDHAWNMVRLNGEWYCVDVTWDWGYYLSGMMNGREWRYFNTTSDYMARTNHQWDYGAVPEATAEDYGVPAVQ